MLNRRRLLPAAAAAVACLIMASGASADPINTFSAAVTPSHVKPASSASYTVVLTNDSVSPEGADRAKIGIPAGFVVEASSVQATAVAAGACEASTWIPDGELIADAKINLKRPELGPSDVCAGATLTVAFTATSSVAEGPAVWASELLRGAAPFELAGSQPTVQVDGTAPQVSITSAPGSLSNQSSAAFDFTADEAVAFECKLDGEVFASCASPVNRTGLADGSHTFVVKATDAAGNTGQSSHIWTVDTTPPVTTITEKPVNPSSDSSPSFTFGAGETAPLECKLDDADFAACSSPKSYTSLAEGSHTFLVRATDAAGNIGPEASHVWTIDTTAPVTTISGKPVDPSNDSSPSFTFTADGPATFRCKLNAGGFAACSSPKDYVGLPDGSHAFEVEATDAAGNTSVTPAYAWTIDTDAPATTITAKPENPSNVSSPSFHFSGDEGGSTFLCKLDAGVFAACSSPQSYPGLAEGSHTFSVKATDAAGNTGPVATHTWSVDTSAPAAAITTKPSNPSNVSAPTLGFTAGEQSTFQCKLDGEAFAACSSPTSYGGLSEGSHTFVVKATDTAGNAGPEASYTWTIDTVAPTAAITTSPADPSNDPSPSFHFGADEAGATFACRLDGGAFGTCASPKTHAGLTDGSHTFRVKATDASGNTSGEAVYTWRIDSVAPAVTIGLKPANPSNTKLASFSFSASEAAALECKLDGGAFAACTSPQLHAGLSEGSHTFFVKGTDAAGNSGTAAAFTWIVDTVAPTVTLTGQPNDPSNTSFPSFSFTASESGSTFQCRLDGAAFGPCSSPKGYSNLAEITHTFVVRATDAAGNTGPETTHEWTIDTTAPTASITAAPTSPSNERSPTFVFAADESSSFSCKLDAGSFAPCTSPKNYGVNLTDGAHTFVVRPSDLAGNVGATVSHGWTIDTTGPIATVTQQPATSTNDNTPTFAFTSVDATGFQCSLDGAPYSACTSPTSYPSLADGEHTFGVRATDSLGNTGLATVVEWTIDTVAPAATITQKPTSRSSDASPTFRFTANEVGSTFTCRLEQGGFAPCTSPKSYTDLADGDHTFTVRATDLAGNTSPEVAHVWTVDTVAPTTTIDQKPSALSNNASPSFAFSAEPGTSFVCKLDAGGFGACSSPKSYPGLVDGPHTFTVKGTDLAGNIGAETVFSWTVDTVAPAAAIGTTKPANPTNDTTPSFSFTTESGSSLACSLDGAPFAGCTSPKTYLPLADGSHTFAVRATDLAGNTGPAAPYTWTIDTEAPAVQITAKPGDPSNVKSPAFSFSADETATFACKLDAAAFATCASPKSYSNVSLTDGDHTFTVRATDPAGNTGTSVAYTWTVDTVAPTVDLTGPGAFSNVKSPSFSFTAGETATFQCNLDNGAFSVCTSPLTHNSLADGAHTFRVKATDAAGNVGAERVHNWTIDTVVPTVAIGTKPSNPSSNQSPSFTFSSNEQGTFECRLDVPTWSVCASPKTYAGVGDGSHTFTVRAIDRAGNPTLVPAAYTWMLDATAPTTQIVSAPTDPSSERSPTFTFSADQPGSFECKLDAASYTACASPKTYSGLADGPHTFTVRAIDTASNTGAAKSYGWAIDTVAPVAVVAEQPSNPSNNRAPSFTFSAAESSGFLCSLNGGALAPCSSPRVYGDLADGPHSFTVRARDAAGNIGPEASVGWMIKTVAAGAALTSAPSGLSNSSVATFAFAAAEPSSFDCKLDDRAFAPCGSPVTYHGLADSGHTFSVRARDLLGNLSGLVEHSWTIDTAAPQTSLTAAPKSGTTATSVAFRFSANEGGTFECRLNGAPFALCVSPKNYAGLRRAAHQFEVRAIDAAGNADMTPSIHSWRIGAAVLRTASSALHTPRAGARVTRPPLLVWRRANRARYYNVQVYRGRRKVLTAWPTKTRFQLQMRWKNLGRKEQLLPGSYRWYVWPGYGAPSSRRYGQLLGQSTFVVGRRSGR